MLSPSAKVVFLHRVSKRSEAHTEEARGLDLDASGSLERLSDVAALDVFDVRFEIKTVVRKGIGGPGRGRGHHDPDRLRQAFWQNRRGALEGNGSLDDVFELADVARPVVLLE